MSQSKKMYGIEMYRDGKMCDHPEIFDCIEKAEDECKSLETYEDVEFARPYTI